MTREIFGRRMVLAAQVGALASLAVLFLLAICLGANFGIQGQNMILYASLGLLLVTLVSLMALGVSLVKAMRLKPQVIPISGVNAEANNAKPDSV